MQFLDAFKKLSATHHSPLTKKLDGSHRKRMVINTIVEIRPHTTIRGPSRDILREAGRNMQVQYLSALMRNACRVQTLLQTMAQLHCKEYPVDLSMVNSKPSKATKEQPKVLTDVPSYQFNKSKSYWREGPISKSFRFRRFGRHELLGWPDDDWNPLLPKWNNVLQPSDPIWVKDHQLNNTILLPGAAMLTMSMEAMKQLQNPDKEISGFNFKNVNFMSALVVPAATAGIETRFCIRPQRNDESDNTWYEFSLYSSNGLWVKNCTGHIQAVVGNPRESASHATESASLERMAALDELREMKEQATTILNPEDFYESLKRSKLQFGPSFEVIKSVATNQVNLSIMGIKTYKSGSPAR
ncbi:unnamed protein product [Penicillium salamii]|uniref:PKS/mFAS DH domain-containing protein n=1 Tax=Penicillium salamii TaxID=1612424 RepID=A0A9W4MZ50_9EURO|nr:unnamed protein product [Penicillium salamii]